MRLVDKNVAVIAKYFNISPMEIMQGDYHYFMYQYRLAVEDETESQSENKPKTKYKKVDSLFEAFGAPDIE